MRVWFGGPRILGVRTGISFGPEDLRRFSNNSRTKASTASTGGTFIYVIKGEHERVKIGVSNNPARRLSELKTGSPFALDFAYICVVPGIGYDIESAVHQRLHSYRCGGGNAGDEWFNVPVEMAVAAISASAFALKQNPVALTLDQVNEVVRIIGSGGAGSAPASDGGRPSWDVPRDGLTWPWQKWPWQKWPWQKKFGVGSLLLLAFVLLLRLA
jgi:Meiotically up-regulated gene 113